MPTHARTRTKEQLEMENKSYCRYRHSSKGTPFFKWSFSKTFSIFLTKSFCWLQEKTNSLRKRTTTESDASSRRN